MRNATNVFGIYRTATNGNVTARASAACKKGGTTTANVGAISRTSIYRTVDNGNITTRAVGVIGIATANAAPSVEPAFTEPPLMVILLQEPLEPLPKPLPMPDPKELAFTDHH